MNNPKTPRGSDQFPLRLPDGMRDRIKSAADENGRSMNAEIVAALEKAFPTADAEFEAALERLRVQLDHIRYVAVSSEGQARDEALAMLASVQHQMDMLLSHAKGG